MIISISCLFNDSVPQTDNTSTFDETSNETSGETSVEISGETSVETSDEGIDTPLTRNGLFKLFY